jgi:hypothetical protein
MNARNRMQDSGLSDTRLLARLLQAGTLVLDESDNVRFASAGACQLFGVADEARLRDAWSDLATQLCIGQWPRDLANESAWHGRADLQTAAGPRAIRFEMHAVAIAGHVHRAVLVRDRAHLLPSDRALLLASEAQANRHVLTGLVHAAKGPLNNFNLTLALLSAGVARADAATPAPDVTARWTRYIDVLRNEAARLAGCIEDIQAVALRHDPSHDAFDLCAMSLDCARVLRHGATMREIGLELDVAERPVYAMGDAQLIRLALLSFTISVLELTSPGGRVGWRVTQGDARSASVAITTSQPVLPPDLVAGIFRLSCTAESDYSAAIAARLIIEAQGGDVVLHEDGARPPGFLLRIPGRP